MPLPACRSAAVPTTSRGCGSVLRRAAERASAESHSLLLRRSSEALVLVPNNWSASNSTLVVSLDSSVRVRFQNERP